MVMDARQRKQQIPTLGRFGPVTRALVLPSHSCPFPVHPDPFTRMNA